MKKHEDTIIVLDASSAESIIEAGRSQRWKINPVRAQACVWVLCVQHGNRARALLGRISAILPAVDDPGYSGGRSVIAISEGALLSDCPNLWQGWRYPVHYSTLAQAGISLDGLTFEPVGVGGEAPAPTAAWPAGAPD
jgi:hypothetical protein